MVLDLCFTLYMNWWKEWRGLNWDGLFLEPLLKPGTDPKCSAVQGGAIWDISSYGSLSKSLQWKLHSFPSALSASWPRSFRAGWDQSWVGARGANWWLSAGVLPPNVSAKKKASSPPEVLWNLCWKFSRKTNCPHAPLSSVASLGSINSVWNL